LEITGGNERRGVMAQRVAVWFGSDGDLERLRTAVQNNCTCNPDDPNFTCGVHKMLADQVVLDHFVFVAKQRTRYFRGEFFNPSRWF